MLANIARFSYKKRWLVVLAWLVLLGGVIGWSSGIGNDFSTSFELPESDSQQAQKLLEEKFPTQSGDSGDLVFKADSGVNDPEIQQTITELSEKIESVEHVTDVATPYEGPQGASQISDDGKIAYATIQFDQRAQEILPETAEKIREAVDEARGEGLQFELGGQMFAEQELPGSSEALGLIAAVVILLIAFGSLLAMGLPILVALFGVGIGISAMGLLSHIISIPEFATQLASMIGIGVGIDYALFIVTRYRQGLREKLTPEESVVTAINTAGRSVVFAGMTVIISLLGMLLMNISFIQGLGVGAAVVVAITMLAAVTLLPAVLGFAGKNIDKLRIPGTGREIQGHERGIWYRWSNFLVRRPWQTLIVGLLIVVPLAIPVFSMQLGSSDASAQPTTDTTRRAYDLKAEGFGVGSNGPLLLAARINGPEDMESLEEIQQAVQDTEGVSSVSPAIPNEDFSAALMQVIPTTSPQDEGTVELIERLRHETLPEATENSDITVHIGGLTAAFEDLGQTLADRLPIFIGTVLALSFVLLLVVFRSLLIPLKAVALNMLSIGAAYGLLVGVFQWGWFNSLLGLGSTGPIESFLPMMLFAIVFGLSMDYEVFLLSRIKEEYDRVKSNSRAVAQGINSTARVITAAAAIMLTVFGSFVFGDDRVIKEFGLGLAAAVLIDATIIRLVLVPATMQLAGKANWWMPKWLSWLPEVHIDGNEVPAPEQLRHSSTASKSKKK